MGKFAFLWLPLSETLHRKGQKDRVTLAHGTRVDSGGRGGEGARSAQALCPILPSPAPIPTLFHASEASTLGLNVSTLRRSPALRGGAGQGPRHGRAGRVNKVVGWPCALPPAPHRKRVEQVIRAAGLRPHAGRDAAPRPSSGPGKPPAKPPAASEKPSQPPNDATGSASYE